MCFHSRFNTETGTEGYARQYAKGKGKRLPDKKCDQLIGELAEFIESKFTKRELREKTETNQSLDKAAVEFFKAFQSDPEFITRAEPLMGCSSGERWMLSATREALRCTKRKLDRGRLTRAMAPAGRTLVEAAA